MSTASATSEQSSFWEQQFAPQCTVGQILFDLAFGIALPVICLYFDPMVFRSPHGQPELGNHSIAAGVAIGLGFLSLSTWLLLRRPVALLVGLLAGGAIFATLLGLVLLPLSAIGLFVLIGVLGFAPFLTAFVFWRNAVRAYQRARLNSTKAPVLAFAAIGLILSSGGPWATEWYVRHETSQAMDMVQSSDPAEAARGLSVLKRFRVLTNFDQLLVAYLTEKNLERRARLAASHEELTGEDIELSLSSLRD